MNLNYLVNELLPQRAKEIKKGKNLGTRQPIYVVFSMQENFVSGHSDFTLSTNYRCWDKVFGYIDNSLDSEEREFNPSPNKMKDPIEVTKFYTERLIAFFLTSKAAHEYIKYQAHNMVKPYVYVFYSGYRNIEMDNLLDNI